jgi:hypothetical protein
MLERGGSSGEEDNGRHEETRDRDAEATGTKRVGEDLSGVDIGGCVDGDAEKPDV